MANQNVFKSFFGKMFPQTDTINSEGAPAYALSAEQALAQYALTGCLNSTYYVYGDAYSQLRTIIKLSEKVSPEYLAKLAVYARERGYMKDLPALLCAVLSKRDTRLLREVFPRVIDNGKMLRTFVQIMRSGTVGRKSLGSASKRLILEWIAARPAEELFKDSVGNDPSLADVIKMVHPKPQSPDQEALFGYLIGKNHREELLPTLIQKFEGYKAGTEKRVPGVPFQMLTSLKLGTEEWMEIAKNAGWQMTRMNLNTFARHGVFESEEMVTLVAERLRNREEIKRSKVFPYQLMVAFQMTGFGVPEEIRDALQEAMEIAVENVPSFSGRVVVCPDVSGSMQSPITGNREGASSSVRCIDVAALIAATMIRGDSRAIVLPFEQNVVDVSLNRRDSVMTNAAKLAAIGGGGTSCSAPLERLNRDKVRADLVVLVSDNQSWVDADTAHGTAVMREWGAFKARNPEARLVCIDLQPYINTQALEGADVLNIGGFSDHVFDIVREFSNGSLNSDHLVGIVKELPICPLAVGASTTNHTGVV